MDDKNDSSIKVFVQIARRYEDISVDWGRIEELVSYVCRYFGTEGAKGGFEVDIAVVSNSQMKELNSRFLDHQTNTDCLSFDLSESHGTKVFELIVNGQRAKKQASARGHSAESELALYITHCLLHNFGFNDLETEEAAAMHRMEDEILDKAGFGIVYNRGLEK